MVLNATISLKIISGRVFFLQESKVATFWGHQHFIGIRRDLLRVSTQRKKYPPDFGVS